MIETLGEEVVWVGATHFGASLGWHIGTGLLKVEELACDGKPHSGAEIMKAFLKKSLHHYDLGLFITIISLGLFVGVVDWYNIMLLTIAGLGGGLLYSDKEDHPPEGIIKHTVKKLKNG